MFTLELFPSVLWIVLQSMTTNMKLLPLALSTLAGCLALDIHVSNIGGNATSGYQYGIMFEVTMRFLRRFDWTNSVRTLINLATAGSMQNLSAIAPSRVTRYSHPLWSHGRPSETLLYPCRTFHSLYLLLCQLPCVSLLLVAPLVSRILGTGALT
jgi:hypothetical protein